MNSLRLCTARLWSDKSLLLLCVLGALLSVSYVVNAIGAFDDLYLPQRFSKLIASHGYLKAAFALFAGMDLPNEYRTYALSRLLQFGIWLLVGQTSSLFPLFIGLSQLGSAILLMLLLRERHAAETTSLAAAVIWLISPFAVNVCFHHYSYLVLPFQLVIATCFVLGRITHARFRYLIAAMLGVACALTGELQLVAGPMALVIVAYAARDSERLRLSYAVIGAMVVAVLVHHWIWVSFGQDASRAQRYEAAIGLGYPGVLARVWPAAISVIASIRDQLREMLSSGLVWGLVTGIPIALAYWVVTTQESQSIGQPGLAKARPTWRTEAGVALALFGLAVVSLAIYVALAAVTGQLGPAMPRRYGYAPVTLLLVSGVIGTATAFKTLWIGKYVPTVSIAVVGILAGQLHLRAIPDARAADASLATLMSNAAEPSGGFPSAKKGVLFFVGSDPAYLDASANAVTIGPKMDRLPGLELYESPFGYYWTSQHYSVNVLGFRYAAMPKQRTDNGAIEVGGSRYPNDLGEIQSDDVIVVANLGLDATDPFGKNVRVFKNFDEFAPHFFGRRINREPFLLGFVPVEEFVIDMGRTPMIPHDDLGTMPDKRYSDTVGPMSTDWVENYGLLSGQDTVYTHPNVSRNLSYYRTNRNGAFTYGVSFRNVGLVEISLDFWEQWGRPIDERVFDLEVSWDGSTWASIGPIDPASINGQKPFSIVLVKRGPKVFQFRMKPTATSKDIPMIQGVRIRRLPA